MTETHITMERNTQRHWGLYAVAQYQAAKNDDGVLSSELAEAAAPVVRDSDKASMILSDLYNERELLDRDREVDGVVRYRYYLNSTGITMLRAVGVPSRLPDGDPVPDGVDLTLPDFVTDDSRPDVTVTDDPDEADHDPGNFPSAKARRRFFAEQEALEYETWMREKHRSGHPVDGPADEIDETIDLNKSRHRGSVEFEGDEELAAEWLDDEDDGFEWVNTDELAAPTVDTADITPDTDSPGIGIEDEREVIGTVSIEPVWDWVGAQLYKLGEPHLAKRAFLGEMSPAEVYGGVERLIYDNRDDPNLDFGSPFPDALSTQEVPVDDDELRAIKAELGINPDYNANEHDPAEVEPEIPA